VVQGNRLDGQTVSCAPEATRSPFPACAHYHQRTQNLPIIAEQHYITKSLLMSASVRSTSSTSLSDSRLSATSSAICLDRYGCQSSELNSRSIWSGFILIQPISCKVKMLGVNDSTLTIDDFTNAAPVMDAITSVNSPSIGIISNAKPRSEALIAACSFTSDNHTGN